MKRVIEYFDRAYIINLADRTDRKKEVIREFSRVGIKIPNDQVRFMTAHRPADAGIFHSIGVRGCYESHKSILLEAARDGLSNVIIIEDDVCFAKIDTSQEEKLVNEIANSEWDIISLGRNLPSDLKDQPLLARYDQDIIGAQFYAVNGPFLPKLIEFMNACELRPRDHPDGGPMPVDGIYNHIRYGRPEISLLLVTPNLAGQRSSRSDITPNKFLDSVEALRGLVSLGRSVKNRIGLVRN